jgi:DNA processing protein
MLLYQIALTLIPGVGDVLGKKLVARCGSAEAVFRESRKHLRTMPRIGEIVARAVGNREILMKAEKEVAFIERYRITPLFYLGRDYPRRLKSCYDSPLILYYKGTADLNADRIVGVVGTRSATDYGKAMVRKMIAGLVQQKILVVSGLAYGIDSCAHRFALEAGLDTVGVLGHGLDRIYPYLHQGLAEKMLTQGGLLSEFMSGTKPDRENFPRRNRIIAGLCDALIVVEAGRTGGALITADLANSYHRDVFAVPGRTTDPFSEGTNALIRTNRAALIEKPEDVEYMMGWKQDLPKKVPVQQKLFIELSPEEEKIIALLREKGKAGIDEVCTAAGIPLSNASVALLNLEFEGVITCMPGKVYVLV